MQQDDTTPHLANDTVELLGEKFRESVISTYGAVSWSPRSYN